MRQNYTKQKSLHTGSYLNRHPKLQQQANNLAVEAYMLTLQFPKYEMMVMTQMIRKLGLSVVNNLAKGFCMPDKKEAMFFAAYAYASCNGIRQLFKMAKEIGYVTDEQLASIDGKCTEVSSEIEIIAGKH